MPENKLTIYSGEQSGKAADEKYCHACGRIINLYADHCVGCGAPQAQNRAMSVENGVQVEPQNHGASHNQIYCHGCGALLHLTALQCPKCGAQNVSYAKKGSKDRVTAGLFALLLGGIGAHHFYLGNIVLGIIYLLFCWTFIPFLVAIVEGIVYFCQSEEFFAARYPG